MSELSNSKNWLATAFVTSVILAAFGGLGMLWFGVKAPELFVKYGPWGDFFGGTLNPVFTFITVLGLLLTIALQRQELSLTRKELERSANALEQQSEHIKSQKFESTLFHMLSMLNEIVDSIEYQNSRGSSNHKGRDAINHAFTMFNNTYGYFDNNRNQSGLSISSTDSEVLQASIYDFSQKNSSKLDHYYRYLFGILNFISSNDESKPHHYQSVQSQLSNQELKLVFYICVSDRGASFKELATKQGLFSALHPSELIKSDHRLLMSDKAFGIENAAE